MIAPREHEQWCGAGVSVHQFRTFWIEMYVNATCGAIQVSIGELADQVTIENIERSTRVGMVRLDAVVGRFEQYRPHRCLDSMTGDIAHEAADMSLADLGHVVDAAAHPREWCEMKGEINTQACGEPGQHAFLKVARLLDVPVELRVRQTQLSCFGLGRQPPASGSWR